MWIELSLRREGEAAWGLNNRVGGGAKAAGKVSMAQQAQAA